MNSVVLIGRLANDVELSYTGGGENKTAVAHFSLAVDRPKRQGEDQGADFIRITVWGRQAEACGRYLSKGSLAAVRGRIETGSYTNREGQKVYTTEVVAEGYNGVEFLGGGRGGQNGGSQGNGNGNGYRSNNSGAQDGGYDRRSGGGQERGGRQESFDDYSYDDLPDSFAAQEDDEPF